MSTQVGLSYAEWLDNYIHVHDITDARMVEYRFGSMCVHICGHMSWSENVYVCMYVHIYVYMWRGLKYLSQDRSLFFARVKSGQSSTWSLEK